jgi:hypothetical protein
MEELIKELISLTKEKELVEADIAAVKAKIEAQLPADGYKDANITITRTAGSTSTSIDLKELEKKEPELYEELLKDYTKTTTKKESIAYRFKK